MKTFSQGSHQAREVLMKGSLVYYEVACSVFVEGSKGSIFFHINSSAILIHIRLLGVDLPVHCTLQNRPRS